MRRRSLFPPGEFPVAAALPLSLWRIVHLRRLDLTLAIYGHGALSIKQRLWPKARQALTEAPRTRVGQSEKFRRTFSELQGRLLVAQRPSEGEPNGLS